MPASSQLKSSADAGAELHALRSTRRLLEEQAVQMDTVLNQLADSDAVLAQLTANLSGCDGELQKSKKQLSRIRLRERRDTVLLKVAWAVFFLTLAYVWQQRLFGLV